MLLLDRLVAPNIFTKMGLWTLGQNEGFYTNPKRNPIAGILRKELGITPVQGRKILEQRQKIRIVCDNLKQFPINKKSFTIKFPNGTKY